MVRAMLPALPSQSMPRLSQSRHLNHLCGKRKDLSHAEHLGVKELDLPPGFELPSRAKRIRLDVVAVERRWQCPQKYTDMPTPLLVVQFLLNHKWLVMEGEDAGEVVLQQQRERQVLEAVYSCFSCIPESPAEPDEVSPSVVDRLVPQIPLTSFIKDEDEDGELQDSVPACVPHFGQPGGLIGKKPNIDESKGVQLGNLSDNKHSIDNSEGSLELLDKMPNIDIVKGRLQPESCEKTNSENLRSSIDGIISNLNAINSRQRMGAGNADPKIATAAAAICVVVNALGRNDLIDQELLVQILKNPSLLKSLCQTPTESLPGASHKLPTISLQSTFQSGTSNEPFLFSPPLQPIARAPAAAACDKASDIQPQNGSATLFSGEEPILEGFQKEHLMRSPAEVGMKKPLPSSSTLLSKHTEIKLQTPIHGLSASETKSNLSPWQHEYCRSLIQKHGLSPNHQPKHYTSRWPSETLSLNSRSGMLRISQTMKFQKP